MHFAGNVPCKRRSVSLSTTVTLETYKNKRYTDNFLQQIIFHTRSILNLDTAYRIHMSTLSREEYFQIQVGTYKNIIEVIILFSNIFKQFEFIFVCDNPQIDNEGKNVYIYPVC